MRRFESCRGRHRRKPPWWSLHTQARPLPWPIPGSPRLPWSNIGLEQLWFFVGVLVAIALDSPLRYIARSLRARTEVKPNLTVFVWQLFLIVLLIEFWVASISLSNTEMGLGQFLLFLLLPFGAMVLSSLSSPTVEPGSDQYAEFEAEKLPFCLILAALPAISVLREIIAGEPIPFDADLVYRVLVFVGAIVGIVIRSPRVVAAHAVAMLVLMTTYLFDVYGTVPV